MGGEQPAGRAREIGSQLYGPIVRAIVAIVALATFAGRAFLVFRERLDGGAPPLYGGVFLGYAIHARSRRTDREKFRKFGQR